MFAWLLLVLNSRCYLASLEFSGFLWGCFVHFFYPGLYLPATKDQCCLDDFSKQLLACMPLLSAMPLLSFMAFMLCTSGACNVVHYFGCCFFCLTIVCTSIVYRAIYQPTASSNCNSKPHDPPMASPSADHFVSLFITNSTASNPRLAFLLHRCRC